MSVETAIYSRAVAHAGLNALIAGRIYPDVAPQEPTAPLVIYQQISTVPHHAMANTPRNTYRYQFDGYATTKTAAIALMVQVVAAFNFFTDATFAACLTDDGSSEVTELDQIAQLYRSRIDFMITA